MRYFYNASNLILFCLLLFLNCNSPFFPPTGKPERAVISRQTPEGVIDQLQRSYESQNIDLFENLFDTTNRDFKYYVPHDAIGELTNLQSRATSEVIGNEFAYIDSGEVFDYIKYSDELGIHRKMFQRAKEITFFPRLIVSAINYTTEFIRVDTSCIFDSTLGIDSCFEVSIFDTLNAELVTFEGTEIVVTADKLGGEVKFEIGQQVFFMKRDPVDSTLWVIDKWFELPD